MAYAPTSADLLPLSSHPRRVPGFPCRVVSSTDQTASISSLSTFTPTKRQADTAPASEECTVQYQLVLLPDLFTLIWVFWACCTQIFFSCHVKVMLTLVDQAL